MLKPVLGSQLNLGSHLTRGLVGYWLMNEGSGNKVFDLSGNGNNLTLDATHTPVWTPGKFGSALSFDGDDDKIERASGLTTTTGITFVAWIYDRGAGDGLRTVFASHLQSTSVGYHWLYRSADHWQWQYGDGGATRTEATAIVLPTNEWHQIALTHDYPAQELRWYYDGRLIEIDPTLATVGLNNDYIRFGDYNATSSWNGLIDIPLIYKDRILSASEIALLYRAMFQI